MQKNVRLLKGALVAGSCLAASGAINLNAQSADALLNKLVEKGILTEAEATELRDETNEDFKSAFRAQSGLPEFVDSMDFSGSFRGRYEGFYRDEPDFVDRHRFRYRLLFGMTADLVENFEVGFTLGSGDIAGLDNDAGGLQSGVDPISNNQSLLNNASKKGIFIHEAYARWNPLKGPDWSAATTIGKMKNPFEFSNVVFDGDYTPEGFAQQVGYAVDAQHSLGLTGGAFVIDEIGSSSHDPYLFAGQVRWDATWEEHLETTAGLAALSVVNRDQLGNLDVPNINVGNERIGGVNAIPAHAFNTMVVDAGATWYFPKGTLGYKSSLPLTIRGDYLHNVSAGDKSDGYSAGIELGNAGRKGHWEFAYTYKHLEANAWYEEFLDSNTGAFYGMSVPNSGQGGGYRAGTNVEGHITSFQYSPFHSMTLGLTAFFIEAIDPFPADSDSQIVRLQADAVWKF